MMKIAIISDTHGHLDARIAEAIADCEVIVHGGDVGPGVAQALERLPGRKVIVRGNNDPADAPWPESADVPLPGGTLVVNHGDRWPAKTRLSRLRREFSDARAVVCGHSHRLLIDQEESPWILNPGAAGRARTYGGPAYLLLTAGKRRWSVEAFRFPRR